MSAIDLSFGPYRYADKASLATKTFETGGTPRSFTVLVSTAYDAGIVGPEVNGIAVFDNDTRSVVLDRHMQQSSGYFGPSEAQKSEMARIMAMDWTAFAGFCSGNRRYRQESIPDAASPVPGPGRAPVSDEVIFPDSAKEQDPDCPYVFPLSTKREIVSFLGSHPGHDTGSRDFALSWNIKVGLLDTTGRKHDDEFKFDPEFDAKWEAEVQADREGNMFNQACEDGLRQWTEGEYSTYPGDDTGKYEFHTAGRMGGHLVLTGCMGDRTIFSGRASFVEWLEEEATDVQLVDLYKVVSCCDRDLADPTKEVEYQFAFMRSCKEQEWKDELIPAMGR